MCLIGNRKLSTRQLLLHIYQLLLFKTISFEIRQAPIRFATVGLAGYCLLISRYRRFGLAYGFQRIAHRNIHGRMQRH